MIPTPQDRPARGAAAGNSESGGETVANAGVPAGRVGRAHGLDGSFYVTRALTRALRVGTPISLAGRATSIARVAGTEQRPIVRLHGVEDRESAEALRGAELRVAELDTPVLGHDEWWAHELEGCAVSAGERLLGTVKRLLELPSCEALEVAGEDGSSLLVPMVKDAIRRVEIEQRRIEVDPDFLGLDVPDSASP